MRRTLFVTSWSKEGIQVPKKNLSSPKVELPKSAVAAAICFLFGTLLEGEEAARLSAVISERRFGGMCSQCGIECGGGSGYNVRAKIIYVLYH